jgi:hypothetical protein
MKDAFMKPFEGTMVGTMTAQKVTTRKKIFILF